jgi:hypothetical protein
LPQGDVGELLGVSRGVQAHVLPGVEALELGNRKDYKRQHKERGLLGLLRRLPKLRRFSAGLQLTTQQIAEPVEAIGRGVLGAKLRVLELPQLAKQPFERLLDHLRAGRLPHLKHLQVPPSSRGSSHTLAWALESRRKLGLPPLTRVIGTSGVDPWRLPGIWACCPADQVEYLEAQGPYMMKDFVKHLQKNAPFPSLGTLLLEGQSCTRNQQLPPQQLAADDPLVGIVQTLAQGGAPGLREIRIQSWQPPLGPLRPLGEVIGQGGAPRLSSLSLLCDEERSLTSADLRAIVDGLEAQPLPLKRLVLHLKDPSGEDVQHMAAALARGGGGWEQLEELELTGFGHFHTPEEP